MAMEPKRHKTHTFVQITKRLREFQKAITTSNIITLQTKFEGLHTDMTCTCGQLERLRKRWQHPQRWKEEGGG